MNVNQQRKSPAGRPPKFAEASAPVTVTLPLRTLDALRFIDRDRARAIVKCVDAVDGAGGTAAGRVELVKTFEGFGLIIVPPCPSLSGLERLRLVEIAPERFLLVALGDYSAQALELELVDLMEKLPQDAEDLAHLGELRRVLSRHRRQESIASGRLLLIGL